MQQGRLHIDLITYSLFIDLDLEDTDLKFEDTDRTYSTLDTDCTDMSKPPPPKPPWNIGLSGLLSRIPHRTMTGLNNGQEETGF